jgi:hypothetical protein
VTGGVKKVRTSTRKIVVSPNPSLPSSATGSVPVKSSEEPVKKAVVGLRRTTIGLVSLLVVLLVGMCFYKWNCLQEEQKTKVLQAWAFDQQYCKAFGSMTNAMAGVETFTAEAQALIKAQQDQLSAKKVMTNLDRQANEALDGYQIKFKKLFSDAVIIRNHAEIAKLEPFSQKNINARYLEELKLGLGKQREFAQSMLVKCEEIKLLLEEMKIQCAKIAAAAIAVQKAQPPKLVKELTKGSGVDFTPVQFMGMKEIHDFRLNEDDLLILAVWNSQPEVECGAEISTLALTRREGGRAFIAGAGQTFQLGTVSLMGLSTRSQFPEIEAVADSQVGSKSNEWVVASMPNITFKKARTKDAIVYKAAGMSESQAGGKRLYASAFVFQAKVRGTYSLDGQMVLQAPNDTAKVSWMIWVARRE